MDTNNRVEAERPLLPGEEESVKEALEAIEKELGGSKLPTEAIQLMPEWLSETYQRSYKENTDDEFDKIQDILEKIHNFNGSIEDFETWDMQRAAIIRGVKNLYLVTGTIAKPRN